MVWPQGDFFVDYYKNRGDFYKNLPDVPSNSNNYQLYDHPQMVVDAATHPELASVNLEDL